MAALLLSLALPAWSDPGDKGKENSGGNNSGNNAGNRKGQRKPTEAVQGRYVIRIAGYYSGSGTGDASTEGIKISATVTDPAGRRYAFQAKNLQVLDDRFSGTGSLDGVTVQIDGRLDPRDGRGNDVKSNEVLKKGRMTFTFSANGRRSRGAGDQRQATGS